MHREYHQTILQKALDCVEELKTNTASLGKWVVAPRIAPRLGAMNGKARNNCFYRMKEKTMYVGAEEQCKGD